MNNNIEITLILDENDCLFNPYNDELLSDDLSNYIYSQCRGKKLKKDITINIYHKFDMTPEKQEKLINCIRENYETDIKENLIKARIETKKEIILASIGTLLLLTSRILNGLNFALIAEIIYIFSWIMMGEMAYDVIFFNIETKANNQRLVKLTNSKINFYRKEIND